MQALALYEGGRSKPVGHLELLVRLAAQGGLLVTQFCWEPDQDEYQYKGKKEFVPTNACRPDQYLIEKCHSKKCKHQMTCKHNRKTNDVQLEKEAGKSYEFKIV